MNDKVCQCNGDCYNGRHPLGKNCPCEAIVTLDAKVDDSYMKVKKGDIIHLCFDCTMGYGIY